jgi:cytoskeletal protein CcmA (bactofilin family)
MASSDKTQTQIKQTTVEEGTEIRGTLHSRCEVVVRGVVDGDLTAPSVVISPTGTVVGNVKADCIRSEGVLAGHVDANEVYLSGSVRSDTVIRAKTLEVKLQRQNDKLEVTFGACVLEVGADPTATAVDAPRAQPKNAAQPATAEPEPSTEVNGRTASDETAASKTRRSVPPPSS